LFIEAKDDGGGGDNWSKSRAKLQSNHHYQQTKTQFFTGQMPFLLPNQQWQSTERKNVTFHGLAPSSPGGLPLIASSWLPWGRVAMPLISPLMPEPQYKN